jgi:ribonuclease P protein component
MLAKKNRADTNTVTQVFRGGKSVNSAFLTFKYILNSKFQYRRISVIAPKSIAKKAVGRNTLRRRGYQALKKYLDLFPAGVVGAIVLKKPLGSVPEFENEIQTILNKIN